MTGALELLDRVRQPAHTGENRCLPCTVVNVAFAVALAVGVSLVWFPAGAATLVASLVAIALRGYLVPGTPALTKRYLPDRVLRRFAKAPTTSAAAGAFPENRERTGDPDAADDRQSESATDRTRDATVPESILWEAGVLVERADDVEIAPWFRENFREAAGEARDEDLGESLATVVGVDADDLELESYGQQISASVDGREVGAWISRAALIADVATGQVLADAVASWDELDVGTRGRALSASRNVLDVCPLCDGHVRPEDQVAESCCFDVHVISIRCQDCDALLFEMTQDH